MKHRTLFQLFLVDFVIFLTGVGLLPLLPLYAQEFGASSRGAGFYLAIAYAAITTGTLLTVRLANAVGYQRLFFGAGILAIPALFMLGFVNHFWFLVILTAIVWFSGGIGISLVSIHIGMVAESSSRGKSFSLTYLSLPIASLVAGIVIGKLVELHGYTFTFAILALAWSVWPILAVSSLSGWSIPQKNLRSSIGNPDRLGLGRSFLFLLIATFLSTSTIYLIRFATSVAMDRLDFMPSDISGTLAIAGLVTIPLAYTIGEFSDRFSRKLLLAGGYLLGGIGAIILAGSGQLWHFWLAAAMVSLSLNVISSVTPALAVDLLPVNLRNRGLPYLNAMRNVAGIIGFAGGGLLTGESGGLTLPTLAATLSLVAIIFLSQVHKITLTSSRQFTYNSDSVESRAGLSPATPKS